MKIKILIIILSLVLVLVSFILGISYGIALFLIIVGSLGYIDKIFNINLDKWLIKLLLFYLIFSLVHLAVDYYSDKNSEEKTQYLESIHIYKPFSLKVRNTFKSQIEFENDLKDSLTINIRYLNGNLFRYYIGKDIEKLLKSVGYWNIKFDIYYTFANDPDPDYGFRYSKVLSPDIDILVSALENSCFHDPAYVGDDINCGKNELYIYIAGKPAFNNDGVISFY